MKGASRIYQEASWPDRVVRRGPSARSKLLLHGAEFKRSNVKERQLPLADCKKTPGIPRPPECNLAPAFANLSRLCDVRLSRRM